LSLARLLAVAADAALAARLLAAVALVAAFLRAASTLLRATASASFSDATAFCSLASAAWALDTDGEPAASGATALPVADFFAGAFFCGAFFAAVRLAGPSFGLASLFSCQLPLRLSSSGLYDNRSAKNSS
jgi:hypothetical protein